MSESDDSVFEEAVKHLEALSAMLNRCSEEQVEAAVRCFLMCEHSTLQQCFMRHVVLPALRHFAETRTDPRNDASGTLARTMLASVTQEQMHLPFI